MALIFIGFSHAGVAQENAGDGLAELSAILARTNTLSAEVEVLLIDQEGRDLQESRARLLMRKPAWFSWTVIEPYEEQMLTDGSTIWRYEPDLEQVTIQPFRDELDRSPVMLLNGDPDSIAAAYEVEFARLSDTVLRFVLHPRRPERLFERMSLTFDGDELREMQFEDSLGQQTSLSFQQVQRNLELEPALFEFTMPDGVAVIDNRPDAP